MIPPMSLPWVTSLVFLFKSISLLLWILFYWHLATVNFSLLSFGYISNSSVYFKMSGSLRLCLYNSSHTYTPSLLLIFPPHAHGWISQATCLSAADAPLSSVQPSMRVALWSLRGDFPISMHCECWVPQGTICHHCSDRLSRQGTQDLFLQPASPN